MDRWVGRWYSHPIIPFPTSRRLFLQEALAGPPAGPNWKLNDTVWQSLPSPHIMGLDADFLHPGLNPKGKVNVPVSSDSPVHPPAQTGLGPEEALNPPYKRREMTHFCPGGYETPD